jgi:hypothetical protein
MPIRIEAGEYCSSEEVAQIAGVTQWAIQRLLREGAIPGALRISERCWIIPLASAEAMPKGRGKGRPKKEATE